MLVLVDILYSGGEADLQEVQDILNCEMSRMGFEKKKDLKATGVCHVYYDLENIPRGVKPEVVKERIADMDRKPERYRLVYQLIPDKDMPQA